MNYRSCLADDPERLAYGLLLAFINGDVEASQVLLYDLPEETLYGALGAACGIAVVLAARAPGGTDRLRRVAYELAGEPS